MSSTLSSIKPHKPTFKENTLPHLFSKVFIVTGGSSGVGRELANILYQRNGTVYIAARSEAKTTAVIQNIKNNHPTSRGKLAYISLKLDDLATIKSSADDFLSKEARLDVLFNNAGVMIPPQGSKTVQGYELQLGVNCLGPWLFTHFLRGVLATTAKTAPKASVRVVWVSSDAVGFAPKTSPIDFDNMDYHKEETAWMKYGRSKCGMVLHGKEFARRTASDGIISVVR
jgi:NAD(P)-dependent dehydrogenase (short-subunit alcohol dehydrogenase family)